MKVPSHQFLIEAEDQAGLLWAVLEEVGSSGHIALEGDLEDIGVIGRAESSPNETSVLRRQTMEPRLDFVVLPTNRAMVAELKLRLSKPGILGSAGRLIHTQIEKDGKRVFIACDNFHRDCTWLRIANDRDLLSRLHAIGIVKAFSITTGA